MMMPETGLKLVSKSLKTCLVLLNMLQLAHAAAEQTEQKVDDVAEPFKFKGKGYQEPTPEKQADWSKVDLNHESRNPLLWQVWLNDQNRWVEPKYGLPAHLNQLEIQKRITNYWLRKDLENLHNNHITNPGRIEYRPSSEINHRFNRFYPPKPNPSVDDPVLSLMPTKTLVRKQQTCPGDFIQNTWSNTVLPVVCPDRLQRYLRRIKEHSFYALTNQREKEKKETKYYDWGKEQDDHKKAWLAEITDYFGSIGQKPSCPTCGHAPCQDPKFKHENWYGKYCCFWCARYDKNLKDKKNLGYYRTGNNQIIYKVPVQHHPECLARGKPNKNLAGKAGSPEKPKQPKQSPQAAAVQIPAHKPEPKQPAPKPASKSLWGSLVGGVSDLVGGVSSYGGWFGSSKKSAPSKAKQTVDTCADCNCNRPRSNDPYHVKHNMLHCCYWCKNYEKYLSDLKNTGCYKTFNNKIMYTKPDQHTPACNKRAQAKSGF